MDLSPHILQYIPELEQQGLVTRTFRRLDPERQRAILSAILDEAVEKGPASINIKNIAARAGVAVGSLYTYFPKRQGLLDFTIQICTRVFVEMFGSLGPYYQNLPLKSALHAYIRDGIEWSQTQGALLAFFGRAAYQGDPGLRENVVAPVAGAMRQVIENLLEQASGRGELQPGIDIAAASRLINALLIVIGDSQLLPFLNDYFQITGSDMPLERILDAFSALLARGILAQEPESAPGEGPHAGARAANP